VDGGPLWNNGEWLEIASLPADLVESVMPQLRDKAQTGTPRQRYVALCLIGQLAGRADPAVVDLCVRVAQTDTEPGVVAAARWAAGRQSVKMRDGVFADDLSKLVYYRVPGCAKFRRGSTPDDPDRLADEDPPKDGVAIQPFFLAETEVTWPAFAEFAATPAAHDTLTAQAAERLAVHVERLAPEDRPSMAVGYLSLNTARRFCDWLSERGRMMSPPRRYRLPTEDEWEYACRAGNAGRFCFGNDIRYVRYFANCDGTASPVHIAGRRMPNWFGLSDMHGGLWERCDTRYPPERIDDPQWAGRELWVYRGGAYHSPAVRCRSAQRNYGEAGTSSDYHGCRLVMELLEP
jgi:formylglycine-generating enzyme required for sulfatase activity